MKTIERYYILFLLLAGAGCYGTDDNLKVNDPEKGNGRGLVHQVIPAPEEVVLISEFVLDTMKYAKEYRGPLKISILQSLAGNRIRIELGQRRMIDSIFIDTDPSIALLSDFIVPKERARDSLRIFVNEQLMFRVDRAKEKENRTIFLNRSGKYIYIRETRKGETLYK